MLEGIKLVINRWAGGRGGGGWRRGMQHQVQWNFLHFRDKLEPIFPFVERLSSFRGDYL